MTARIAQVVATGPASDLCETLREDGAVIVEDLLGADLLARFNRELDPLMAGVSPEQSFVSPPQTSARRFELRTMADERVSHEL